MLVNTENTLINTIVHALLAQSGWEWLAASLGIAYVLLASKTIIWCWPAALISTFIYTLLFWEGQLPMQAALNVYYMGMAVYGFWLWQKHTQPEDNLTITQRPLTFHLAFIATGLLFTLIIGLYLANMPNARLPYLDAAVTVFSVMNTLLMAKKILESWLYWIVINLLAITLYFQTGYYVTIIMFSVYFILAFYGYRNWKALKTDQAPSHSDQIY